MGMWLVLAVMAAMPALPANAQSIPVSEQLNPVVDGLTTPTESVEPAQPSGLVTVESDLQQADNVTGVVTATGNVKISYPPKQVQAWARQAQYFTKEERIVLTGDVDVIQDGGNRLKAERITYLVLEDRMIADPAPGDQVMSNYRIQRTAPLEASP
jgi:lipopolysaccharide export system protein LptA